MDLQSYIQLKEAYTNLRAPKVEVSNELVEAWVHHLVEEEGLDLSDMTWDELTEAFIEENIIDTFKRGAGQIKRAGQKVFGNASQRNDAVSYEKSVNNINSRKAKSGDTSKTSENDIDAETKGRRLADPKYKAGQGVGSGNEPTKVQRTRAQNRRSSSPAAIANTNSKGQGIKTTTNTTTKTDSGSGGGGNTQQSRPTKAAPKPAAQTGNKAADMKSWAKANPKLAAAKAKRDATRGTSATSNPLMKDLAKRMPKPAAPKPSAAPKPTATAKPMSRIAKATSNIKPMKPMKEDFDIILDHLAEQGFPQEEALKLMVNMSEEKRTQILALSEKKDLSIQDQMRISREHRSKSPEDRKAANEKAMGNVEKKEPKKDERTDAEKMADATGPRKGSNYRGD